jgi:hypothetical protein
LPNSGGVDSLRALKAIWNANSHWHYHLRKREGAEMLRLIDATPIPLDQLTIWAD